ncbi:DUF58 domain-containing protein [Telluria aromaticivorans]|uniref:DUF58 domain-containing protein n=1 Tax=Telluria aromaticivorans TaxID=2725995 RepID=A0A7Y2K005_9BURK|nr:DUF58 domain-containing protein [Telluria aromaticivorans]NNG24036.1 DUF58 domain-containing protein [Telluria aromaticivorans]
MSLAKTALIAHTQNLDLVIRHVLAGLGHGIHAGRERGAGVEFSEYRAYAPGDEWRRVDWKLLARADRYYVREAERDSHVAVWLVLDASASMSEPSRSVEGVDKLAYARTLLGCVAAIAQRQGDAFGLVILNEGKVQFTPALRGPRHLQRVLLQLSRVEPAGALPDADTLRASLHFAQSPSVIFATSDLLDWPSPLSQALLRLRGKRHDVRVLCLQTQAEVDASFSSTPAYRDPEQGSGVFRFGADLQEGYRRNREEHFTQVTAQCRKSDIPLVAARIEQPPGEVLRLWLRRPGSRP